MRNRMFEFIGGAQEETFGMGCKSEDMEKYISWWIGRAENQIVGVGRGGAKEE